MKNALPLFLLVILISCTSTTSDSAKTEYVNNNIFPTLKGHEDSLFFPNKSIADQLPMDCEADVRSQMIFSIGSSLYNSGQLEDAADKLNYFFWDAGERNQSFSERTIHYVLMLRAYALSEMSKQDEAQAIHEFRMKMLTEDLSWTKELPPGLGVNEHLEGIERKYVEATVYEELSIVKTTTGQIYNATDDMIKSQSILMEIDHYKKSIDVGLLFMNNCLALEQWEGVFTAWNTTWDSMKLLMQTEGDLNIAAYPEGFTQMHRYLLKALVNTNQITDAIKVSDRLVGYKNDLNFNDGYDDNLINKMLHEAIGN